ncbi:hypothetical protein BH10CYA1_BH10CYA1_59010 [soil metagenome]
MRRRTAELPLHLILLLVFAFTGTVASAADQQNLPRPRTGRRNPPFLPPPPMVPIFGDSHGQLFRGDSKRMAEGLFNSAVKKHANRDLTGAIADYLEAIKTYDKEPAVHWYLGTAYEAAGKKNEAQQEFEKEKVMKQTFKRPIIRTNAGCGT